MEHYRGYITFTIFCSFQQDTDVVNEDIRYELPLSGSMEYQNNQTMNPRGITEETQGVGHFLFTVYKFIILCLILELSTTGRCGFHNMKVWCDLLH